MKTVWTRKTKPDFPSNFQIDNNILRVRDLKESDGGMYECIITYNGVSENMFVTIDVTSKLINNITAKNLKN